MHPKHPERICWGCDKYCPVDALECGNGSDRTQHPVELLEEDWPDYGDWGIETETEATRTAEGKDKEAPWFGSCRLPEPKSRRWRHGSEVLWR